MKAAWYTKNGSANDVLNIGEMETPSPTEEEVLVRVHYSGVNPSDVKMRQAHRGLGIPQYDRTIPHSDGSGIIEGVGRNISEKRIGERVWLWNAQWHRPFGTASDHITLPSFQAPKLPDNAALDHGACLGIPAQTAHRCVFADGDVKGQKILITGGAGSVSYYAIQMAKIAGASVLTTVSTDEKASIAQQAGADHIINYKQEDVASKVLAITNDLGVDRIIDLEFGGNLETSEKILKNNGVICTYGSGANPTPQLPFYNMMFKAHNIRLVLVYILPETARKQAITEINGFLERGALKHMIAETYSLDDIVKAHEAVESGNMIGNVLLKCSNEEYNDRRLT